MYWRIARSNGSQIPASVMHTDEFSKTPSVDDDKDTDISTMFLNVDEVLQEHATATHSTGME